jgi:hypothetical protein
MPTTTIAHQRLHQQALSNHPYSRPEEMVRGLGAVQAQDYGAAKWALGLRLPNLTDADIEQAFNEGRILRTHVLRPTWHFVTPEDIRWMLELTAPRVNGFAAYYYRKLELDEAVFQHAKDVIIKALEGGKHLTREELTAAVEQAGIQTSELRMTHMLMWAELAAVICSGARRGKQQTYALLSEWAPQAKSLPREEALAELTRRYFMGHGPAMVQDFVWWSGLTVADAKAGIEMVKSQSASEEIGGQLYWFSPDLPTIQPQSGTAYLLPNYDEYSVGYSDRSAIYEGDVPNHLDPRGALLLNYIIVMDSQVIGAWSRTFKKGRVIIQLKPFAPFTSTQLEAVQKAAQRYGEFLGLSVEIVSGSLP